MRMRIIEMDAKDVTIKRLRKTMREATDFDIIYVKGWGQIQKLCKTYAIGPVPEKDDSDPLSDYSAWSYGLIEKMVLWYVKRDLKLVA